MARPAGPARVVAAVPGSSLSGLKLDGLGLVGAAGLLAFLVSRSSPGLLEGLSISLNTVVGLACVATGRRAWRLLGAFLLVWSLADLLWILTDTGAAPVPPLLPELVYLLGVPLAVGGMLRLPAGRWESGAGLRVLLDALVLSVPVLAVADVLLLPRARFGELDVSTAFLLVWPVVDVLVCSLAFVLSRRRERRMQADLALLVLAFAVWTFGDTWLAWLSLSGGEYLGSATQVPFVVAPLLVGLAAWASRGRPSERPVSQGKDGVARHATCRVVVVLPDVVVVGAGLVCIAVGPERWHEWVLIGAGALLAAVRYGVVAFDAQDVRETLEQRVEERTARLQEARDRLTLVTESVAHAIVGLDAEGRVAFVNRAALELLGAHAGAVLGRSGCDVLCGQEHSDCPLLLAAELGHRVERAETVFRRADGALVPVELALAPVPPGDDTLGSVVTFHDVTERRAVEQAKQQFVTSVSHELRTPLAAIRGALEMLGDGDGGELPEAARHLVGTAERGAGRLSRLVEDLLEVERMAGGTFSVSPRPVEVAAVVREVVAVLGDWAAGEQVLLRTGLLEGVALADPHRVEQALVNLVANAVKFSEPGGVVHLSARRDEAEVVVSVRDEGRGIPASDLPRVFERFHQVAAGDATERGGTGLGLAITRSIVERHGGRIWAESTLGEGSTFSFTLPAPLLDNRPEPTTPHPVAG